MNILVSTIRYRTNQFAKGFGLWKSRSKVDLNLLRRFSSNVADETRLVSFQFVINKFNDVHIKHENIIKFAERTNNNLDQFEQLLKSIF